MNAIEQINWAGFQTKLADYVRLELAGEAAEAVYPEMAFYIQYAPACQAAYDGEFRRQGLAQPIETLLTAAQQQAVVTTLHQVFAQNGGVSDPAPNPAPNPDWVATAIEHGRVWIDRITQRWQQVELSLAALQPGLRPTIEVAGFLSDEHGTTPTHGALQISPEGANFEVMLTLEPDGALAGQYQLAASVTLFDRFGDFSGVQLTLLWGDTARVAVTDALGHARFSGLPIDQLPIMQVRVKLPD